ncbi:RNA polymerase sigma factor [Clostridia bacterium]|nr:RNA polymerase sigma factor [Clostridia bacterium]
MEILRAIVTQQVRESVNVPFEDLVDGYGDSVYKFCRSLTYAREDADDLFQEVFLKAFEQFHKISGSDNPKAFLFSSAIYVWKSWKRKHARRSRLAPVEELDENIPGVADVEEAVFASEEVRLVREIVAALPEKFRLPVVLYYTLEMSLPDIASALNLPGGTVKSRLFKARKLIKKGLMAYGYEA